jgi:HAD superfamily hydrolase (TIGR01509 family)
MEVCAAIFDLDGTLVDSAPIHAAAWAGLCAELGQAMDDDLFRRTFGKANRDIIPELLGRPAPLDEIERLSDRKEALYRELAASRLGLMDGARALLAGLAAEGWRLAIGSSTPRANLDFITPLLGLDGLLGATVGMEDVAAHKPAPDVFLEAARRLGVPPPRCLVFEDAPAGVQAALAGGMTAIGLLTHHPPEALAGARALRRALGDITPADCRAWLTGAA